jgi:hypothetical protein
MYGSHCDNDNDYSTDCMYLNEEIMCDRLCGLVARVPGYSSTGPGSIPAAIRFPEK